MTDGMSGDIADLSLAQRNALELRLLERRAASTRNGEVIPRREVGASIPLSFAQQRLWFLDQLYPGRPTYNLARRVRMKGVLDVQALRLTLEAIVARHEALRTRIVAVDGTPEQIIAPS